MKKDEMILEYLKDSKEAKKNGWKVEHYEDSSKNKVGIIDLKYSVYTIKIMNGLYLELTAEWVLKKKGWEYDGLRLELNNFNGGIAFECKTFGDFKAIEKLFVKRIKK